MTATTRFKRLIGIAVLSISIAACADTRAPELSADAAADAYFYRHSTSLAGNIGRLAGVEVPRDRPRGSVVKPIPKPNLDETDTSPLGYAVGIGGVVLLSGPAAVATVIGGAAIVARDYYIDPSEVETVVAWVPVEGASTPARAAYSASEQLRQAIKSVLGAELAPLNDEIFASDDCPIVEGVFSDAYAETCSGRVTVSVLQWGPDAGIKTAMPLFPTEQRFWGPLRLTFKGEGVFSPINQRRTTDYEQIWQRISAAAPDWMYVFVDPLPRPGKEKVVPYMLNQGERHEFVHPVAPMGGRL